MMYSKCDMWGIEIDVFSVIMEIWLKVSIPNYIPPIHRAQRADGIYHIELQTRVLLHAYSLSNANRTYLSITKDAAFLVVRRIASLILSSLFT